MNTVVMHRKAVMKPTAITVPDSTCFVGVEALISLCSMYDLRVWGEVSKTLLTGGRFVCMCVFLFL